MEHDLLRLLEYQGVLSAIVTTPDGLVVATAGLDGDDAEVVAAAGASAARSLCRSQERAATLPVAGGVMHLVRGRGLMLVVLAEPSVPVPELSRELVAALVRIDTAMGTAGAID